MLALPQEFHPFLGWMLRDVQSLPEDCRVEVLDGALIVNPSPLPVHQRITRRLVAALEPQLPSGWQLETYVDVMLAEDPLDYLTPGHRRVQVRCAADHPADPRRRGVACRGGCVRGARREDRGAKPLAHAEGGIQHFWRLEGPASGMLGITVHTYELPAGADCYDATGTHRSGWS